MSDLVLHPVTRQQLEAFVASPAHAVLLSGPLGSGKFALAGELVEAVLGLSPEGFERYSYGMIISSDEGKAIGIEAVRELEHFLSLKVPRRSSYNRAVIIENAQLLTLEAQNALLKTLEEPPPATLILLTVNHSQALLPTIRSRAQSLDVQTPPQTDLRAHFMSTGFSDKDIDKAQTISGGLPGLMHALLTEADHPLRAATEMARRLLQQPAYARLLTVDELAKNRPHAAAVAFILQRMAHAGLQTAAEPLAAKWRSVLEASYNAVTALQTNAQPKLVLTNLMLHL